MNLRSVTKSLIRLFYEYENAEEDACVVRLFRKAYCLALSYIIIFELKFYSAQFTDGDYRELWEFDYLSEAVFGISVFYWLRYLIAFFLVGAAFSVLPRIFCGCALFCFLMLTFPLSMVGQYNASILIVPTLFLFAIFDLRKSKVPLWVRDTFVLLLSTIYFHAAISKLKASGMDWIFGDVLIKWLERYYLMFESPFVKFLILNPIIVQLGAALVWIFELTFFLALIRRFRPFYIVAGIGFHTSVFLTLHLNFAPLLISYLCFLGDLRWFRKQRAHCEIGT